MATVVPVDLEFLSPTTAICTAFSSADYKTYAADGAEFLAGYNELRNVDWIDLPTSHWPMWSRPGELAAIIGEIATARVS